MVLCTLPLYLLLSLSITPALKWRLDEKFQSGAEAQAFLTESVVGMGAVKSLAMEGQACERWDTYQARYVSAVFRAGNLSNIASQLAGLISKLTTVAIIWWGVHLVLGVITSYSIHYTKLYEVQVQEVLT